MKIINEKLFTRLFIVGIIVMFCLIVLAFVFPVSAAENVTNETSIRYLDSEDYQNELQYWYDYYVNDRETGYESKLRIELNDILNSGTLSDNERNDAILIKLGWDFRLENYMNPEKRTIDDETGNIQYNLGIGNWWMNLFNNGIKEETLPKTIAEGDALYKIYTENYNEYINVLKGENR